MAMFTKIQMQVFFKDAFMESKAMPFKGDVFDLSINEKESK